MIDYTSSYRFDYLCGWRYLFSPRFRGRMRIRWGRSLWTRVLCYAGVLTSLLVSTTFLVLVFAAGWHLANG